MFIGTVIVIVVVSTLLVLLLRDWNPTAKGAAGEHIDL